MPQEYDAAADERFQIGCLGMPGPPSGKGSHHQSGGFGATGAFTPPREVSIEQIIAGL